MHSISECSPPTKSCNDPCPKASKWGNPEKYIILGSLKRCLLLRGDLYTHLLRRHQCEIRLEGPFGQERHAEHRRQALGGLDEERLHPVDGHRHALVPSIPEGVFVDHLGKTPHESSTALYIPLALFLLPSNYASVPENKHSPSFSRPWSHIRE